jgi:hypothetical protein
MILFWLVRWLSPRPPRFASNYNSITSTLVLTSISTSSLSLQSRPHLTSTLPRTTRFHCDTKLTFRSYKKPTSTSTGSRFLFHHDQEYASTTGSDWISLATRAWCLHWSSPHLEKWHPPLAQWLLTGLSGRRKLSTMGIVIGSKLLHAGSTEHAGRSNRALSIAPISGSTRVLFLSTAHF